MVWLEFALLFGCIVYAAKLGGIGVGMAGGLGMAIAVFGRRHRRCRPVFISFSACPERTERK